ncbi:hypothetical protein Pmani_007000 [Petrolisthes manimaculis]|uniref:EMC1 first beta-propeller domain-containing protein n=1 Tax=Petrolisthes manimaculis TaxID=1843537 RepID=A0AAE1Q974_9EUCA|nr:hypothetical protein Pmani_007000 [Petrolisthes manimaculis]
MKGSDPPIHNVLAALATKNGDIVWRQVLESGENGRVEALVGEGQRVTSVAGRMVRTWDTLTAALIHKTYLSHTPHPGLLERVVVVGESELVLGEVVAGSVVVVTTLDRVSGSPLDHTNVVAPWISTDTKCGSAGKSVGCVYVWECREECGVCGVVVVSHLRPATHRWPRSDSRHPNQAHRSSYRLYLEHPITSLSR